ncbi:hypothetical protein DOTSEDRAFT_23243 [Dothistroma septosporum NZE10]|uniref:Uncharacterized protein n=1 Tax=Dothistroma septosporum (strain NZE10 / CBS 128990) TaxID=675120 RepID=N1PP29_DOTSN|nr:hypothetical protein DOTSEDRAFT_23243 [Dothistroma septosporum NZE10]
MDTTTIPQPLHSYSFGPGYYAVLENPTRRQHHVIRSAYTRLKNKSSKVELTYEDPTKQDWTVKEARIQQLETAVTLLTDPGARYKHDVKHQTWDASWTAQEIPASGRNAACTTTSASSRLSGQLDDFGPKIRE